MIKCDRLEEVQSLMAISQYCINHEDNCCSCKLLDICDCMTEEPFRWVVNKMCKKESINNEHDSID